jgi:type III secretion system FlhB-like substrate exporter
LSHELRTTELPSKEVFINVNDLIIELLLKVEIATSEVEKKVYRDLADRLSHIRDKTHKVGKNAQGHKL